MVVLQNGTLSCPPATSTAPGASGVPDTVTTSNIVALPPARQTLPCETESPFDWKLPFEIVNCPPTAVEPLVATTCPSRRENEPSMEMPPACGPISKAEFVTVTAPPPDTVKVRMTFNGALVPVFESDNVLVEPIGADSVRLLTVRVPGEFVVVESMV